MEKGVPEMWTEMQRHVVELIVRQNGMDLVDLVIGTRELCKRVPRRSESLFNW